MYIHTYIPLTLYPPRDSRGILDIPPKRQNCSAMSNTADVTGRSQSISGVIAINHLVAFYDIHGRQREVLFFYFVPNTT
jgi:hypothetical protein